MRANVHRKGGGARSVYGGWEREGERWRSVLPCGLDQLVWQPNELGILSRVSGTRRKTETTTAAASSVIGLYAIFLFLDI